MESIKEWYIVYTKPGFEQKVCDLLTKKKVECFSPLNRVIRLVYGKQKTDYKPLFNGFVFVYADDAEQSMIKQTSGVINFMYWLGAPAIISDEEIYTLRRFLNSYESIGLEQIKVKMNGQAQMFYESEITEEMEERQIVKLSLPSIGYNLIAADETANVTVISTVNSKTLSSKIFYANTL